MKVTKSRVILLKKERIYFVSFSRKIHLTLTVLREYGSFDPKENSGISKSKVAVFVAY